MNTQTMIQEVVSKRGFEGAVPLFLGCEYAVASLENALNEGGIAWGSRCEAKGIPASYGRFRRWVVLVREADIKAAEAIADKAGFRRSAHLATLFYGGALCLRHDYELEPCTRCCTGYDWWAKTDDAEEVPSPRRHASPL